MYATYTDYIEIYSEDIKEGFNRYAYEAGRYIDDMTTTLDGVRKLHVAFPCNPYDATAVKRCECELIHHIADIEKAGSVSADANGTHGGSIRSVSSGTESITYANEDNQVFKASSDEAYRKTWFNSVIRHYLSGICDRNGVNLLYGGVYPCTTIR